MRHAIVPFVLVLGGCGSAAQFRIGGEPVVTPRDETVMEMICAGDEAGALRYLASPDFRLSAAGREEWLSKARADKRNGECPCAAEGCK